MKVYTKGSIIVNDIKIADIHYEYQYGCCIKSQVLTLPVCNDNELWSWDTVDLNTGKIIKYSVNEKYQQYAPNLYDYEAY